MVYIPPEEFSKTECHVPRSCSHCGYSLQGLQKSTNCPECGEFTRLRTTTNAKDIPLSQMPESFVRRLAFCCIAMFVVFPAIAARAFLPSLQIQNPELSLVANIFLSLLWIAGVYTLTTPLHEPEAERHGLGESGKYRKTARGCSITAIGISAGLYINQPIVYITTGIVCVVGLLVLFLMLA